MRPSLEALRDTFDALNELLWAGRLPRPVLSWVCDEGALGGLTPPCGAYPNGRIEVAFDHEDAHLGWQGTLLHEAIHLALEMLDVDEYPEGEVAHHGPAFAAECNRCARVLGLPEVTVEDSWMWPHTFLDPLAEPSTDE